MSGTDAIDLATNPPENPRSGEIKLVDDLQSVAAKVEVISRSPAA